MAECWRCGCDVPGSERVCRECFDEHYSELGVRKNLGEKISDTLKRFPPKEPNAHILLLRWVVAGVATGTMLYFALRLVPVGVQGLLLILSCIVLHLDFLDTSRRRSRATLLYWVIAIPTVAWFLLWKTTGDGVWMRLTLVGQCLVAAYVFIDRRRVT